MTTNRPCFSRKSFDCIHPQRNCHLQLFNWCFVLLNILLKVFWGNGYLLVVKSLNVFCKLFFILSSSVALSFLNTVNSSSRYKPTLFLSYFSLILFNKNVPTSLYRDDGTHIQYRTYLRRLCNVSQVRK